MKAKPQLVLDIAGVILTNLSTGFWQELPHIAGTSFETLKDKVNTIRKDLWTGTMKEDDFWIWLKSQYPSIDKERAYILLQQTMLPLPAIRFLKHWSQVADIHLMSDHCKEWLEPYLEEIQDFTKSITISNQVGYCKPQLQIYEIVKQQIDNTGFVLYVDDQEKNLKPAQELRWRTLLADEQHKWIEKVETILFSECG